MPRVFVYGTLKRGFRNHQYVENARFVGEAYTVTHYCMLDGRFPVLRDSGSDRMPISGEVYDVDAQTLIKLDDLESVASGMYDRMEIDVTMIAQPDERSSRAFLYMGCGDYWDKKEMMPYLVTDRLGHLNWLAPDMRSK
jgi:gamma-glutamylaminecyclotransferase